MGKVKIGVQLYSVRNDLTKDMAKTIKRIAEIGYEAVEFYGGAMFRAEDINAALKENNLDICGWHTPWQFVQEGAINAWIAYCKAIGNKYVVVPGLPKECTGSIAAWKETASKFNEIEKTLAKDGLLLGYHNHWDEFKPLDGEIPWDAFFNDLNPGVIAQYDIGNSLIGTGIDAMAYHNKYIGRGITVHAKPYSAAKEGAPIGEDDIDWAEYVSVIKKAGVMDYCIVEYEIQGEKLYDNLATCYNTLKKLF